MSRMFKVIIFFILSLLLTGCEEKDTRIYSKEKPVLTIQDYFNGKVKAYGIVQTWTGKVVERFVIDMQGSWQGQEGIVKEKIIDSLHGQQNREWHFRLIDQNHFVGTAQDTVGELKGEQYGNTIHARYRLKIHSSNGKIYEFDFDEWFFRIDDRIVLDRTRMKKYGVTIGQITLSFIK